MKLPHVKKTVIISLIIALVIAIILYLMHHFSVYPSTDDAYLDANKIDVAAQVTGPVKTVDVEDHQFVKAGQLLFTIDPEPFQIAVDQSAANVLEKTVALKLADQNAQRYLHLVKIGQETQSIGDQYRSQLDSATAALTIAKAQLANANLNLLHTKVFAPAAGVVTQFTVRPGNNIVANNPLFTIIEQNAFWVNANFKETQLERIRQGQPADVVLDMYPNHHYQGSVVAVSSASGSIFSLLPPENASGNWVKVTQRFPVKILVENHDANFPLRAGASATVSVDTSSLR